MRWDLNVVLRYLRLPRFHLDRVAEDPITFGQKNRLSGPSGLGQAMLRRACHCTQEGVTGQACGALGTFPGLSSQG